MLGELAVLLGRVVGVLVGGWLPVDVAVFAGRVVGVLLDAMRVDVFVGTVVGVLDGMVVAVLVGLVVGVAVGVLVGGATTARLWLLLLPVPRLTAPVRWPVGSAGLVTRTGALQGYVPPSPLRHWLVAAEPGTPNCPEVSSPQAQTRPSAVSARLWPLPAATAITVPARPPT